MLFWPGLASVILVAAGYVPTRRSAGDAGLVAMIWAVVCVTIVVYATLVPTVLRMTRASGAKRLMLGFRAMGIRFMATVMVAAVIAWKQMVAPEPFLMWVALAYVILTMIESWILIRWNNWLERQA